MVRKILLLNLEYDYWLKEKLCTDVMLQNDDRNNCKLKNKMCGVAEDEEDNRFTR